MENNETQDSGCAPSGPAGIDTGSLSPDTTVPPPDGGASPKYDVFDPPAYLQALGQALQSCAIPGMDAAQTADQIARDLRGLELTSTDSDCPAILKAHVHVLSGAFANLLARGMKEPVKHQKLIASAFKAQSLCAEAVKALRQLQDLELRQRKHGDDHSADAEKTRLLRIRMGFKGY